MAEGERRVLGVKGGVDRGTDRRQFPDCMLKLCIFGTSAAVSYGSWWAADALGAEVFTGYLVSGVGAVVGCWLGWKIHQRFF